MSKLANKIITPSSMLIEKTAAEYAAIFWEACRSSGMKQGRHKTARAYARANLEQFIPLVVQNLIEIMGRKNTPVEMKEQIYQALQERTNDPDIDVMAKAAGTLPDFEQTILYKPDNEKPKPVIINTPRLDFKNG